MDNKHQSILKMAALGRTFHLGNFYDYYTDNILEGSNTFCWDPKVLTEVTEIDKSFKTVFECPESDSTKWDHMRLDDHTRASVLTALVDKCRGASNYVNDRVQADQVTRILICRVKTRRETFEPDKLEFPVRPPTGGKKQMAEATHVVVGIVYGVEAYCVLTRNLKKRKNIKRSKEDDDSDASEDDDGNAGAIRMAEDALTEVAEKMQIGLQNNQPLNEFKEEFNLKATRELMSSKCRLYSDARSQSFRECNVFDAYKECLGMTQDIQFRQSEGSRFINKEVPIELRLLPLNAIATSSNGVDLPREFHEIDSDLLSRCDKLCSKLEDVSIKAEALRGILKKSDRQSLTKFMKTIEKYRQLLRNSLKEAVVTARKTSDEKQLETVIEIAEKHKLFKISRLNRWLKFKQAEIDWITKTAETFGVRFLTAKVLANELSDSFEKKHALVLSIPSPEEYTTALLSTMKDHLSSYKKLVSVKNGDDSSDDDEGGNSEETDYSSSDEESDKEENENDDNLPWPMVDHKQKSILARIRQLANFRDRNKNLEDKVHFLVVTADSPTKCCSYSIYELNKKLNASAMFDLPGPPNGLKATTRIRGGNNSIKASIAVNWNYQDLSYPCHFVIEYRKKGDWDDKWIQQRTAKPGETSATIATKHGNVRLEIRVAAVTCVGRSEYTTVLDTGAESIDDSSGSASEDDSKEYDNESQSSQSRISFVVEETQSNQQQKSNCSKKQQSMPINVANIAVESARKHELNQSSKTENSDASETTRFAEIIANKCQKVGNRNNMDLYEVPLKPSLLYNRSFKRFTFNYDDNENRFPTQHNSQRRTVLLMGAIGSDKTALINAMINYVFSVEWEDSFRFELIQDRLDDRSQSKNQISQISVYDINYCEGFRIPFSLTIVDTPSYGDTKELDKDQEITQMVSKFFEDEDGIQEVDAIAFVEQASLSRFTPIQMYIFDSIFQIFGHDVKDSISFLLTSSDGQTPPILRAIADCGLPWPLDRCGHPQNFKFNNAAFFCANTKGVNSIDKFNSLCWKMSVKNFQNFFSALSTMKTTSLSLTRQVLQERRQIESTVKALKPLIETNTTKIQEVRKAKTIITHSRSQIINSSQVNTNLLEQVLQTTEQLVKLLEQDIDLKEIEVKEKVKFVAKCMKRLDEIALCPKPLLTPLNIDLIIASEKGKKTPGFQQRMESLKEFRQMAVITSKIRNNEFLLNSDSDDGTD